MQNTKYYLCKQTAMPQGAPYIHSGDPAYAPPVLRAPSPSSSIGTEYPPDESTQAEEFMTEEDFVKKLKLNHPWITEAWSWRDPLLPKPKDAAQEARERRISSRVPPFTESVSEQKCIWPFWNFSGARSSE